MKKKLFSLSIVLLSSLLFTAVRRHHQLVAQHPKRDPGGLYPYEVALDTTEHPFERELCSRTFLLAPEFPLAADAYAEEPMGDLIPFPR